MVIIAVVAIAAIPRTPPTTESLTIKGRAEQLAAEIRYTQTLSMTRGARFCIVITASTFQLRTTDVSNNCTATAELDAAGQGATPVTLCGGCMANTFGGTLQFDGLGRPYTAAATLLAANGDITLADQGGTKTVRVSPQTGRVIVQ